MKIWSRQVFGLRGARVWTKTIPQELQGWVRTVCPQSCVQNLAQSQLSSVQAKDQTHHLSAFQVLSVFHLQEDICWGRVDLEAGSRRDSGFRSALSPQTSSCRQIALASLTGLIKYLELRLTLTSYGW